jgi:hypothetical protein
MALMGRIIAWFESGHTFPRIIEEKVQRQAALRLETAVISSYISE